MKVLVLLACIGMIYCKSQHEGNFNQKGYILDWISNWIGAGGQTTTTSKPVFDPPENCPQCQCGISRTRNRIVGGHVTKTLEFPWMAVMLYNGRLYCGGTLINDLYVLTAAHCTAGFRKERMSVRFLEHDRSNPNETKTIDRKVEAIIRHLRYSPGTYDNDIALIKLNERVDLSSALKRVKKHDEPGDAAIGDDTDNKDVGARPVCLPAAGYSYSNHTGVVVGWGTTEEGGSVATVLQEVKVPIISNSDCRKTAYRNRITENMLCAGLADGGKDACQGDSGGPLHVQNATTLQYQEVGVVSWGEGCARPDRPGVYSRVNRYLTWIYSNTRDACYCY